MSTQKAGVPKGTPAYPLAWPFGRPRSIYRGRPAFKSGTFAQARDGLLAELKRLGATDVVLSTNVELRGDGLPYAGRRQPDDPGVAVYFARKGRDLCLVCDRWAKVEDNMDALARWVEAQRGQERWVGGDFVDAVFAGFAALPPAKTASKRPWHVVLSVTPDATAARVKALYLQLAQSHHPDRGGSVEAMAEINEAYDAFKEERGL